MNRSSSSALTTTSRCSKIILMKAEKRKELHTNALRHSISRLVTRLKEKPGQFSYMVWGIVILVAGTVIAGIYFYNERKKANSARWEQLAEAMTAEDLNKIIKNNKDTPAARDARLKLARALWASGEPGLHDDTKKEGKAASEDARAKLAEAAKTFEELVGEYGDMPILVQECYFNAGKIHESLARASS